MKMTATKSKTKLQPLGNRVLAKRLEAEETLKGGLILPDTAKQKQETAEILALGTGKKDNDGKVIPFSMSVGDKILIEKYAGQEVSLDGEEYIIVKEDDVIAVVV
ncbi:10 kDa chaperonin [Chlamydiales bacterium SCGC AB-751-O23]|jgi:chaperonin GroES|nr:10 kDa chaperonin [Chlamydiales bacterium SCGC AB-751-O23]